MANSRLNRERLAPGRHRAARPREVTEPGRYLSEYRVVRALAAKSRQRAASDMPVATDTAGSDRIFESRADEILTIMGDDFPDALRSLPQEEQDAELKRLIAADDAFLSLSQEEKLAEIKITYERTNEILSQMRDHAVADGRRFQAEMREILSRQAEAEMRARAEEIREILSRQADEMRAGIDRQVVTDERGFVQRWGEQVAAAGYTSIPGYLLSINQFMDKNNRLSSTELLVLLQILSYWWYADQLPFPSKSTISKRLGLSPRQVQRALNGLEQKQLIERVARFSSNKGRRTSNSYDMTKLIDKVRNLAAQHPAAFRPGGSDIPGSRQL
jgi:DNA-binding MarR family transcriptional regulator